MDFRKALGGPDNLLLIIVGGVALLYVATGANAWADEKWGRGAGAASGAAGLLKGGKLVGKKEGYEEGFNTFNPALHLDEVIRYQGPGRGIANTVTQGIAAGVTTAVVNQGVDYAMANLPQWPGSKTLDPTPPPPPLAYQQQIVDPRDEPAAKGPKLPQDWWVDGQGRYRDGNNRVASDDRRRDTLRQQKRQ